MVSLGLNDLMPTFLNRFVFSLLVMGLLTIDPSAVAGGESLSSQTTDLSTASKTLGSFSLDDNPKYPSHFDHFDYANPDAPKGGVIRLGSWASGFSSMNPNLVKGVNGPGSGWPFDTLMVNAADDPHTLYPRLAKSLELANDGSFVIFNINEKARFNKPGDDGCDKTKPDTRDPVTAEDVAFSFDSLKKYGWQGAAGFFKGIESCEVLSDTRVRFRLKPDQTKSAIMALGDMQVYSKKFYSQPGQSFDRMTNEPPTGSGPYIADKITKDTVSYKRVCNYWGKDLPTAKGLNNFDRLEYTAYRDRITRDSDFQKGVLDYKYEDRPNLWPPSGYANKKIIEDIAKGNVTLHEVQFNGAQVFECVGFNNESPALRDPKVRQALSQLYEAEFISDKIKAGNAKPVTTYFPGIQLDPSLEPEVNRLLLEEKKNSKDFPDDALHPAPPIVAGDKSYQEIYRERQTRATELMKSAGWKMADDPDSPSRKVWMKNGLKFPTLKWPSTNPDADMIYADRLNKFGLDVKLSQVQSVAITPIENYGQFDLVDRRIYHADIPGVELPNYWSSAAAEDPVHTLNITRTRNSAIDHLVEKAVNAKPGTDRQTAIMALDRVLKAESPIVLTIENKSDRLLIRNRFDRMDPIPKAGNYPLWGPAIDSWWEKTP